jgi:alpha-beta hydrolase superfamily lysophospholipase
MKREAVIAVALLALVALGGCAPMILGAGPATREATIEPSRMLMRDGAALPFKRWGSERHAPRAIVLAVHGFNDYSKAFESAGPEWARAGIVTYAYDQRGFGAAPNRGRWAGNDTYIDDLAMVAALLRARYGDRTPLFVLGESMGGAVVMAAGARGRLDNIDGAILVAPAVRGREAFGPIASGFLDILAHLVPWMSGPSGSPGIQPSDNIPMLRKFSADPLVIKNTRIDAAWGLLELMDEAAKGAERFNVPSLVLFGARDILVPGAPSEAMLRKLPPVAEGDRRVTTYDNGWHMLLRDLDGPKVRRDIAKWILEDRGTRETRTASR